MAKHRENKMTTNTFKAVVSGVFLISFGTVFCKSKHSWLFITLVQNVLLYHNSWSNGSDGRSRWLSLQWLHVICFKFDLCVLKYGRRSCPLPILRNWCRWPIGDNGVIFLGRFSLITCLPDSSLNIATWQVCLIRPRHLEIWLLFQVYSSRKIVDFGVIIIIYSGCLVCGPGTGLGIKS